MSGKLMQIRWDIIFTALCLMVVFWVTDAFLDGVIYAERGFFPQLIDIEVQELIDRLQTFLIVCLFAGYAWRQSSIQEGLKVSLEEAITAHKAERARAEAILAAMGDAVSVQDEELKVLYQNKAHKELMGDHVGEYCYKAYQHRDSVCPVCHLVESFADGLPHRREAVAETERGTTYVEIYSSSLRDANGMLIAGIESVRDITDRKLTEIQLRRQLAAIEASMDGIAILNAKEEYLYLNEAHATVYGYESPDELIGKSWHVLYDEQERQRLEPLIVAGFEKKGEWRGEATGLKRDGSGFPQEISLTLLDEGGLICVIRDISQRKKSEEAIRLLNKNLQQQALDLQATNRDLEAFSYSLSHDLRSPLTRIYTAVQAIDTSADRFNETDRTLLQAIFKGCECMEEFINAMLVLFRVTQSEILCSNVDLSSLTEEIMAGFRLQQSDRQVEVVTTPDLVAWCDPQLARILLENLLGNAWKYTSKVEHTRIEFGFSETDGAAAFYVRDNGAGFDMTEVERLFKPFQRLHGSSEFPGTGVGLATVLRIIERHGGRVWGEGTVGGGAVFYFTLARSESSQLNLAFTRIPDGQQSGIVSGIEI